MVSKGHKNTETEVVMLAKIHSELREKARIENNLIISGLVEGSTTTNPNDNTTTVSSDTEEKIVNGLLDKLHVDKSKIKKRIRLKEEFNPMTTNRTCC